MGKARKFWKKLELLVTKIQVFKKRLIVELNLKFTLSNIINFSAW